MRILILGSGGREHSICYKLKQSNKINKLICIPGNAGTQALAENINIDIKNFEEILKIIKNMKYSVEDLIQIMNELRDKCPWDKKQTLDSLKTLTIEEAYELIEAIDKEDYNEIKEELGDLLLHVVFYSKLPPKKTNSTLMMLLNP